MIRQPTYWKNWKKSLPQTLYAPARLRKTRIYNRLPPAEKRIGSSLQAAPSVYVTADYTEAMAGLDLSEIAITSNAELIEGEVPEGAFTLEDVKGIGVVSALATGEKCIRCYKVLPEVGSIAGHEEVCGRCAEAADQFPVAAQ